MRTAVYVAIMALYGISILAMVAAVGKPRKTVTGPAAAATIVLSVPYIAGITYLWASA